MSRRIAHITLVVKDYDEAIHFYTEKLGFKLQEDTPLGEQKRWVLLSAGAEGSCNLLLAKAASEEQSAFIGNQAGGRVFLFLHTDDFDKDHKRLLDHHITIVKEARTEPYGKVLVFEDLYGNRWDLVGP